MELPDRKNCLMAKDDPKLTKSRILKPPMRRQPWAEAVDASRTKDRTAKADPRFAEATHENENKAFILDMPATETEEPKRANVRTDKLEPQFAIAKDDKPAPKQQAPTTDMTLPALANCLTASDEPSCKKSMTLNLQIEPNRAPPKRATLEPIRTQVRSAMDDPKCTQSKVDRPPMRNPQAADNADDTRRKERTDRDEAKCVASNVARLYIELTRLRPKTARPLPKFAKCRIETEDPKFAKLTQENENNAPNRDKPVTAAELPKRVAARTDIVEPKEMKDKTDTFAPICEAPATDITQPILEKDRTDRDDESVAQ
mmetsp:Transcript_76796/g.205151  ORF Transcript_76796/g.205151 Transcript_76796/m.205151 type:complete len:315 (-) Transcript_76796:2021-2965(-)